MSPFLLFMNSVTDHPDELLPWYVNGTLATDEQDAVASHLEHCGRCRDEVAFLQKLRRQVKGEESQSPGELGFKRLQRDIKREKNAPRAMPSWWRQALAAGIVVILVQSALIVNLSRQPEQITPLGARYDGVVLQLSFAPDATEIEIRKLLERIDATLVGGPSAVGVYRVRLDVEPEAEKQITAAIAILREHKGVITHVARE